MNQQSKSILQLTAILAGVLLLIVAAARFFGSTSNAPGNEASEAANESPYVIRSIPTHAQVYINNALVGTTPFEYDEFDSGILRVRLEHENLAPIETLLIVPDGGARPIFPEFVFSVPVELSSLPVGAQPVVNGRPLRPYEVASYRPRANDTSEIAFVLDGETSKPVKFNPLVGLVDKADTVRWHWSAGSGETPAQLTGVFAKSIRVTSIPSGADIFLDDNPLPIGRTDGRAAIPYGDHNLIIRLEPFDDFVVVVSSTRDRSEPISAVLMRSVWLAAVDAENPYSDLKAHVSWVRYGQKYVVNPDDRVSTPGSILLEGKPYEILLSCPGYSDTAIILAALASEATVAMRPLPKHHEEEVASSGNETGWVRFVVKQGRQKGVEGAEVFGVDKNNGQTVRYGPTDEAGELTVPVPLGDYDWWAAKEGFVSGKPNGERVKGGRKTKEITLKVKPM